MTPREIACVAATLGISDLQAECLIDAQTYKRMGNTALAMAEIAQAAADNLLMWRDAWAREARKQDCTWQEIGDALGLTRQAAQQRYAS